MIPLTTNAPLSKTTTTSQPNNESQNQGGSTTTAPPSTSQQQKQSIDGIYGHKSKLLTDYTNNLQTELGLACLQKLTRVG